ncbi:hypothetical protein MITSMUL_05504 [Mitsuokella multacida DSM 20544]|uniref:Uncharacterized protein n=1 Tax=Mitsuokella multacida DSM 20544 TaxID=500635 RepID=C9KQI8_9FIRM|nr:hypothetical protein MITSMUL_05504 [Mitsuokella multacida DSM 20544]
MFTDHEQFLFINNGAEACSNADAHCHTCSIVYHIAILAGNGHTYRNDGWVASKTAINSNIISHACHLRYKLSVKKNYFLDIVGFCRFF